nr:NADH dehydrogenase subunit 2 [Eremiaphila sp.]
MPNNSTKILFLMTLFSGMLISLCANSWFGVWMGLEINLLSFIPLISTSNNSLSTEASLKYFLIQTISSSSLLFMIFMKTNMYEMFYLTKNSMWNEMMILPMLMKMAAAPLHWWLPSVMEGLSWTNCFLILSVQKIAPLILIAYLMKNSIFMQTIIMMSAITGALGGFNQTSLRKILAFSSINHISWMLIGTMMSMSLWLLYFTIYMINILTIIMMMSNTNSIFISQKFSTMNYNKIVKLMLNLSLLSLGGMPPLLGFLPKWILIQFMIQNMMIYLSVILIASSLMTLFYYLRIMYSTLMISNSETMWMLLTKVKKNQKKTLTSMTILLMGMLICNILIYFL